MYIDETLPPRRFVLLLSLLNIYGPIDFEKYDLHVQPRAGRDEKPISLNAR